jgi:hypothetical protein
LDAVAEEMLLGEFFDVDDLGGDEDGGLAFLVGDGDFDEGLSVVVLGALEAEAAFGHVFAGDDVFAALGVADASGVVDFDARVLAAVGGRGGGFFGRGWRQGEDGGAGLVLVLRGNPRLPSGLRAGRENGGCGRSSGFRRG